AAGAQEARRGRALVAGLQGVAPARLDLVAHALPLGEPRLVVARAGEQRAADTVDLVALGPHPRRPREAEGQAHPTARVVGKIEERGVVLLVHESLRCAKNRLPIGRAGASKAGWGGPFNRGGRPVARMERSDIRGSLIAAGLSRISLRSMRAT